MEAIWSTFSDNFKKYNLGCGDHIYREYLNVGFWRNLEQGTLYKDLNGTQNTFMLNHDLRLGVPAADNSLDLIYHSHMLEHLSYDEAITFTEDCLRTLRPGGRMRILVPDLELWINAYVNDNMFFFEEYRKVLDSTKYVTKASIFMGMLHNHEHKCGYDFESLKWLLENVGFTEVKRRLYGDGEVENLNLLEELNPLRTMESLCIECKKP